MVVLSITLWGTSLREMLDDVHPVVATGTLPGSILTVPHPALLGLCQLLLLLLLGL